MEERDGAMRKMALHGKWTGGRGKHRPFFVSVAVVQPVTPWLKRELAVCLIESRVSFGPHSCRQVWIERGAETIAHVVPTDTQQSHKQKNKQKN